MEPESETDDDNSETESGRSKDFCNNVWDAKVSVHFFDKGRPGAIYDERLDPPVPMLPEANLVLL